VENNVFGASCELLRHCHSGGCVELLDICVFIALFTTLIQREVELCHWAWHLS